jgi:uncharacterized protein (TIGR03546 family)
LRSFGGTLWNSLLKFIREYNSPRELAIAIGIGVWIGISPFWGFHTILAFCIAFICRLNAPAVLLGTMISNPWFAPFIIFLSLQIGCYILDINSSLFSLQEIQDLLSNPTWEEFYEQILVPYLLGSFLLGILLAILAFWLTLWMAKRYTSSSSSFQ